MIPEFWKGKRVLITGHTGFKGSWMTMWLKLLGAKVIGYALAPPSEPSLFELADVGDEIDDIRGDVRDLTKLSQLIADRQPEIVIHMAAQSLVRPSYSEPVETYATNVMGTVHLLEAIRKHPAGVRAVLVITSDKCYENREWDRGYREEDAMGGYDPYSSSKGCAELVTASYRRSFFQDTEGAIALASARAGNVIGGGDWAIDRLMTDVMTSYIEGGTAIIRNPAAVRPWQHVLEPVYGYLLLCERLWENGRSYAEGWNFGPKATDTKPVSWIVERLSEYTNGQFKWEHDGTVQPHEAKLLALDATKAAERLQWMQRLSLDETLQWVVEWYRAYKDGEDVGAITQAQINKYQFMVTV